MFARSEIGRSERERIWSECAAEIRGAEAGQFPADLEMLMGSPKEFKAETIIPIAEQLRKFLERPNLKPAQVARAWVNIAIAEAEQEHYEEAINILQDVIRRFQPNLHPSVGGAHAMLAVELSEAGRHKEALEQYKKSRAIVADSPVEEAWRTAFGIISKNAWPEHAQGILNTYLTYLNVYPALTKIAPDKRERQLQQAIYLAQAMTWINYVKELKLDEALPHISDWIQSVAFGQSDDMQFVARALILLEACFPTQQLGEWIALLESSESREVAETAKIHRFILDLLLGDERRQGPGPKARRALARVPPELRQTVEETFKQIKSMRIVSPKAEKRPVRTEVEQ